MAQRYYNEDRQAEREALSEISEVLRHDAFHPACSRASISKRLGVHDLRHTAASLMIQAKYPPKMLQEIMRHASITTTLDLYGHLYPATSTATPTASTPPLRKPVRPKSGQTRLAKGEAGEASAR